MKFRTTLTTQTPPHIPMGVQKETDELLCKFHSPGQSPKETQLSSETDPRTFTFKGKCSRDVGKGSYQGVKQSTGHLAFWSPLAKLPSTDPSHTPTSLYSAITRQGMQENVTLRFINVTDFILSYLDIHSSWAASQAGLKAERSLSFVCCLF